MKVREFVRFLGMALTLCACVSCRRAPDLLEVLPWRPEGISSPAFESHAAFDPRTGDLYFVRSTPSFSGWRLLVAHCTRDGWSAPAPPAFAGDGVEADPWFTPDGGTLYFISTRTTDGLRRSDLDIWRITRNARGEWGVPARLGAPVNSPSNEWFPRLGRDGWLYFGSARPGGLGQTDLWRARLRSDTWVAENLGPAINSGGNEFEGELSPDGSRLIIMADDGLYQSSRSGEGWSPRQRLPAPVNDHAGEVGAAFAPNGSSILYSKDTRGPLSGEFFVWHIARSNAWPPDCTSRDHAHR